MYNEIKLDELSAILDSNLDVPSVQFDMRTWHCGTSGCMIGNDAIKRESSPFKLYFRYGLHADLFGRSSGKSLNDFSDASRELGMTELQFKWLFGGDDTPVVGVGFRCKIGQNDQQKPKALARLAKFILYKRRKREAWADFEAARRIEGDNMYADVDSTELVPA